MFSEALRVMDHNTEVYMVEQLQKKQAELETKNEKLKQEMKELNAKNTEMETESSELKATRRNRSRERCQGCTDQGSRGTDCHLEKSIFAII